MDKKILLSLFCMTIMVGCGSSKSNNESYLEIKEDIAFTVEKNAYTCKDDEFFFIESTVEDRIVNFIYGSYSSPLSKKPSKNELYSDGVYNLSFLNNEATVKLKSEIVLQDCRKVK